MGRMNAKQKRNKKQKLIAKYGSCCWWCRRVFSEDELTIDHLIPQSCGGSNNWENLRLACLPCNKSRGNSLFPPPGRTGNCF
jgi:5-methylcytosine-specific restriction endonuclease McrA